MASSVDRLNAPAAQTQGRKKRATRTRKTTTKKVLPEATKSTAPAATSPSTKPATGTTTKPGTLLAPLTLPGSPASPTKSTTAPIKLGEPLKSGDPAKAVAPPLPQKPAKPAPTMTFDAVDVSGKSSERQKLEAVLQKFRAGDYENGALAAHELMTEPKYAELSLDAQYLLAKTLYRMGLYHSSLAQFSKVLAKGPNTQLFKPSLEWLFFISHKTTNEAVILDEIAKYSNFEFPDRFRHEFRYLLARYHFVRGRALDAVEQRGEADKSFGEVKRLALSVPRGDAFYGRAKYLEGLSYFREAKLELAVSALKEVIRVTRPGTVSAEHAAAAQAVRDLAFMQLARIHYGLRQNRFAIYYFNKIERGRGQWLEALFESAWANYRIGQYEQALGNLITLSSPFFREEYFPEALILKAVIYYENCRYRESSSILQTFEQTYLPVAQQLDLLVKKDMPASEYYAVLAEVQRKNATGVEINSTERILERILNLALTDKDLAVANRSILELEAEMDALTTKSDTFKYSELTKGLLEGLKAQREKLIEKAGVMAKGKLETELEELTKLLGNGERIKFETTTKEKEFLEQQLMAGGKTAVVKKYKYSVAVADDELYWPYEGEYWRDELGTYQYTLTKGCIERDTANVKPSRASDTL
ncbi:MAG: adventurous gliding motility protein GltC [Myxococcaceae bacterium]